MTKTLLFVLAAALATATALALSAPASGGSREVRVGGSCTGAASSKLRLKAENGRIEVEFELDQNRNGRVWDVVLKRNGNRFFRGARTTQPPSGSFELRRLTANGPGRDRVTARAVARRGGQVCRAAATW
jgi:hypothetical protein